MNGSSGVQMAAAVTNGRWRSKGLVVWPRIVRTIMTTLLGKTNPSYKHLTPEDVEHFLEHGWLKVGARRRPR